MSGDLAPASAAVSGSGGGGAPFQLTVDGGAAASGMVNFSMNVMARLSQSGIDTFTYSVSMLVGRYIPCGVVGLKRFYDALGNAPVHAGFNQVMWFGFGHKTPMQILSETETGCKFAALSACLTEIYSRDMAARIMLALTGHIVEKKTPDGQERMGMPSLFQMARLVEKCSGVFATSSFPLVAEHYMSFDKEKIVGLRAWPHRAHANGRARVSRGIADVKDICNALYAVMELGQGVARRVTLIGVADAAAIAAIAVWLMDLKVILYTSEDEAVADRVWDRNCEEEEAQLIVIYSRRFGESAVVQKAHTVYLPDATVLFKSGAQMKPSHNHVLSGRVSWDEAFRRTFHEEFDALLAVPELLGKAIGSAARVFTALAEADPALDPDLLRLCTLYFPASYGLDFVYFCQERFPELRGAELEAAMAVGELAQACNCSTCCPRPSQRAGKTGASREEQRVQRITGPRCLVVMTTAIIRLVRGLSGLNIVDGLNPSRKGLEYIHRLQTQRVIATARGGKTSNERPLTVVDSVIEFAISELQRTEATLLRFAQYVFRAEPFAEEEEDRGVTAISNGGICCYYDVLRDPQQDDPVMLCRVNVIPGYIQVGDRLFYTVSEKITKLFDVGDKTMQRRPFVAVPEKTISTAESSYGGKLQVLLTESIGDSHPSLELALEVKDRIGRPITVLGPAHIVQNVFRSTGRVNCTRGDCSTPAALRQDLTAALKQLQAASDGVTSVQVGDSKIVVFEPDPIVLLVALAQCWEPIIQRGECLFCCLRAGCELKWADFPVVRRRRV